MQRFGPLKCPGWRHAMQRLEHLRFLYWRCAMRRLGPFLGLCWRHAIRRLCIGCHNIGDVLRGFVWGLGGRDNGRMCGRGRTMFVACCPVRGKLWGWLWGWLWGVVAPRPTSEGGRLDASLVGGAPRLWWLTVGRCQAAPTFTMLLRRRLPGRAPTVSPPLRLAPIVAPPLRRDSSRWPFVWWPTRRAGRPGIGTT